MDNAVMEEEKAIAIEATYEDFDGEINRWRESFYTIWRWQLTWSFAYRIEIRERRTGVYLWMLIKPAYKANILDTMDDLGYREIKTEDVTVGLVSSYDFEGLEDLIFD